MDVGLKEFANCQMKGPIKSEVLQWMEERDTHSNQENKVSK